MDVAAVQTRLPRFRRASEPPTFRITDGDIAIVRHVAQHRFLRSTHIAQLIGRSLDRTNERLMRLYHAGYIDRPRAQLDYYPNQGSAPYVYALANRGARLLAEHDRAAIANLDWSRKNREAGRPFIEHQIEVVNFAVALRRAVARRSDVSLIPHEDMNSAASRRQMPTGGGSFALGAKIRHRGKVHEISVVPDFVFGLQLADGKRRNFMVEIDRGTMPVTRSDIEQTSIERKMRVYLAAHAAKQHQRQFGWKNFRVLMLTTDTGRLRTMTEAAQRLGSSATLFLLATFDEMLVLDPLADRWRDCAKREVAIV